jgi:hypothetical protein
LVEIDRPVESRALASFCAAVYVFKASRLKVSGTRVPQFSFVIMTIDGPSLLPVGVQAVLAAKHLGGRATRAGGLIDAAK